MSPEKDKASLHIPTGEIPGKNVSPVPQSPGAQRGRRGPAENKKKCDTAPFSPTMRSPQWHCPVATPGTRGLEPWRESDSIYCFRPSPSVGGDATARQMDGLPAAGGVEK